MKICLNCQRSLNMTSDLEGAVFTKRFSSEHHEKSTCELCKNFPLLVKELDYDAILKFLVDKEIKEKHDEIKGS